MTTNFNSYTESEVRSGFFVTLSALLLLGLLFMCGDTRIWSKTYELHAQFNFIAGLTKNSPVQYAGHEVGKVTNIHFVQQGKETKVNVTMSIRHGIEIRKNTQVFIEVMGFMGEKYVEMKPGTSDNALLAPGSVLQGVDPVPLMEVVHRGTLLMDDFEKISKSLQTVVAGVDQIITRNRKEVDSIFVNLNETSKNVNEMTHDLKRHPWKLVWKSKEKKK